MRGVRGEQRGMCLALLLRFSEERYPVISTMRRAMKDETADSVGGESPFAPTGIFNDHVPPIRPLLFTLFGRRCFKESVISRPGSIRPSLQPVVSC